MLSTNWIDRSAPIDTDRISDVGSIKASSSRCSGMLSAPLLYLVIAAGMTYDLIFMRFLKFVKNGRNFYEEKKAGITGNLTSTQAIALFKALQTKLIPS